MLRIALIVNPVAGIGGPAGLAGSDGVDVQRLAAERGSQPKAGERARQFLSGLSAEVAVTGAGPMGADAVHDAGLRPAVVVDTGAETSGSDTVNVARRAVQEEVDLIVFVGGDGTARDALAGIGSSEIPMLGIPAGVKMHSAVFALSPKTAASLVAQWRPEHGVQHAEVADIDEDARRQGLVVSRLHGQALVPNAPARLQGGKLGASVPSLGSTDALATVLETVLDAEAAWVFGPGGTTAGVATALGIESSLLGVDLVLPGGETKLGVSARDLEALTEGLRTQVVLSPIGGQGFLLGRGNQQISPKVLARVAKPDLIVVATSGKLAQLGGAPLLIDTGDSEQDARLSGYARVHTGPNDTAMLRVHAASSVQ